MGLKTKTGRPLDDKSPRRWIGTMVDRGQVRGSLLVVVPPSDPSGGQVAFISVRVSMPAASLLLALQALFGPTISSPAGSPPGSQGIARSSSVQGVLARHFS